MVYMFKVNNKDTRTMFIDISDVVLVSLDVNYCHKELYVRCCGLLYLSLKLIQMFKLC